MSSIKHDTDKPKVELVVPAFTLGVAKVLTMGAEKYSPWNWLESKGHPSHDEFKERCLGALLRHTLAYQSGETIDPESGLPHMYHIACNTMFISEYDNEV